MSASPRFARGSTAPPADRSLHRRSQTRARGRADSPRPPRGWRGGRPAHLLPATQPAAQVKQTISGMDIERIAKSAEYYADATESYVVARARKHREMRPTTLAAAELVSPKTVTKSAPASGLGSICAIAEV